jgi:hypothetical protein
MCVTLLYLFTVMAHCTPLAPASPSSREGYSVYSCALTYFSVVRLEAALGTGEVKSVKERF